MAERKGRVGEGGREEGRKGGREEGREEGMGRRERKRSTEIVYKCDMNTYLLHSRREYVPSNPKKC